jgi:hypothetical protein
VIPPPTPEHPIYLPLPPVDEDAHPEHPIYYPVYPAHPIEIPPTPPSGGEKPEHPIYYPVYPAHPIVLPPEKPPTIPGLKPEHPIYLPPDQGTPQQFYVMVADPATHEYKAMSFVPGGKPPTSPGPKR